MRPSEKRKWSSHDEPSPREKREMKERGEWSEDDSSPKKAKLVFRVLAWASLIAIFFAVGYGATSLVFDWMNRENKRHPNNYVTTPQQAQEFVTEMKSVDIQTTSSNETLCTLSIPEGSSFTTRQIRCSGAIREDVIQQALSAYMDAVKESNLLDPSAQNINLFQSGDWLYLNMNQSFLTSLTTLGPEKSKYLLTGLVKTMSENFAPISKVKFYVNGKEMKDKKPVDLSAPWGLSGKSR